MNISDIFDLYISSVEAKCATSTYDTYKYRLNTARKKLKYDDSDEMTYVTAQEFLDSLSESYSNKTLRGIYDVVNAAFKFAVSNGYIKENPFETCQINQVVRHNPIILSSEQVETLVMNASKNHSLYIPILIAIETGLRRSEVLALTWKNVDFSNSTIEVSKNLINAKKHIFTDWKEHQKRSIPMSDCLSETLLNLRNYRRNKGIGVGADDFICLTSTYSVLEPTYFNKIFRNMVNSCKELPYGLRFHDLRWTYINKEVMKGTDPMSIADKVGHKSCVFTMDYYYRYHRKVA